MKKINSGTFDLQGIFAGTLISSLLLLALSMCGGLLIWKQIIPENVIGYVAAVIVIIPSVLGSWVTAAKAKKGKLFYAMMTALLYFGLMMLITAVFFGAQYEAVAEVAVLVAVGAVIGGVLSLKEKKQKFHF